MTTEDIVLSPEKIQTKLPDMCSVVLYNDDYTPAEFVIEILNRFFGFNTESAIQLMVKIHNDGSGVCGIYTRDIAETKVSQVGDFAKANEQPTRCSLR